LAFVMEGSTSRFQASFSGARLYLGPLTVRIGWLTLKRATCSVSGLAGRLPSSATAIEQPEQTLRSHPDTMALPSGVYTIQNVKYRNWAMIFDANEGEVVAGSSASTNVGEKVSLSIIRNHQRRLTKSCSGSSTDWQTGHIPFRINSTTTIMRLTPLLISCRIRQQFPAYGTLH
jgi:hypothetical protein